MSNKEELVFINCIHEGCKSQRMFMKHPKEKLPEYVCTKHRRLHRVIPEIDDVVIKSGFLLKKGAHSSSFTKRCVVLLHDRMVIYDNVGDPVALACINLANSSIEQDRTVKKRFTISCRREKRKFSFESVLDVDHAEWFYSIKKNIEELEGGENFKSIDEDDYISPGVQITVETKRPSELKKHHAVAVKALQEKLKPRLLNSVKGDNDKTLTLDIWTGTWNMGECDPPFNLEEWVPNSFDLIAVGVEECMKLPDLEMRCNGIIGSDYVFYEEKVGSTRKEVGFHGYIAVIVFIRIELIQCGLVPVNEIVTKNVALGKNLVVTRASNKGGVRVRCPLDLRVFNMPNAIQTQVDFICCHLASDQKGVSKIQKRNKNAVELVQSLVLDDSGDRKGYVFVMGDMNYRIDMAPEQCLELIVEGVGKQNPEAFFALIDNDQLTPCLATSATFPGFQELTLPSFAPTYKRKRLEEGDPKGYTDPKVVFGCYDHEMKDAGATRRTPSFTDRILFQAYPTDIQSMLYIYKYHEIDYIRDSDHSPVYGATTLRIGPNSNKGHIFKKIIPTIPRNEMLEAVSQDTMFRILVNNRGLVEPMRKQLLTEAFEYFSPSYIHRDTLIIKAGDSSSCSLLFIVKGSVKLVTEKYELTKLGPGQWFGGQALIEDHCGYTAIAEEDTVCLSLNESALERMIKKGYREFALSIKRMVMGQCIPSLISIFDDLISDYDEDTLNLLNYQLATTYMDKDTVVCNEGEDLATAFYVIGGQVSVTMKTIKGDEKLIALLGPGAVIGTELLTEGTTCLFNVKTNSACLFRSLSREDYQTFLTLDTEQQEAGKMYDQRMFHWVNSHELPLNGMKQQLLKLISEIFNGQYIQAGKAIWDPSMKARKLTRIILNGKATMGKEEVAPVKQSTDNEFDVDVSAVSASQSKIVGTGCILNQFDEPLRAVQDCMVLDLDKKQLKKLCMLLRWKYFGVGAANLGIPTKEVDFRGYGGLQVCVNDIDGIRPVGAVHVILTSLDIMGQTVIDEEFQTKDIRTAPYYWAESFRFGAGSMGIEAIAAIRIQVIQGLGHVIGEGMMTMDMIFTKLQKDGYLRHVLKLKNPHGAEGSLFFTMKALSQQEILSSLDEMPLEEICVSRNPNDLPPQKPQDLRDKLNLKNIKEMANVKNIKEMANVLKEKSQKSLKSLRKGKKGEEEEIDEGEEMPREEELPRKGKKDAKKNKGRYADEEEEEELPRKGKKKSKYSDEEEEELPRKGKKKSRYSDDDEEEEPPRRGPPGMPPRRGPPGMPGMPPRSDRPVPPAKPGKPPKPGMPGMPPRPMEGQPPPPPQGESKAKMMVSGFLSKFKFGSKAPRPEGPPPEAAQDMNKSRYDDEPPRRRRYEDEEDEEERPRRRRYEDEEDEEERPRRRRYEDEESSEEFSEESEEFSEESLPRTRKNKRGPQARRKRVPSPESISSGFSESEESEPEEPEGKPTPFHTGRRVPYIPLATLSPHGNPFAKSCGNPFAVVGKVPPTPTPSPLPNTAFDAFAPPPPPPETPAEGDLPVEKPVPRPGFNPFAAKQKNVPVELLIIQRRPAPRPGFNPFANTKPLSKTIVINGKKRPNPFD